MSKSTRKMSTKESYCRVIAGMAEPLPGARQRRARGGRVSTIAAVPRGEREGSSRACGQSILLTVKCADVTEIQEDRRPGSLCGKAVSQGKPSACEGQK